MAKEITGPKAPKDPTKKRPAIYLMLEDAAEGRPNGDRFEDVCFLEGRVFSKITALMPDVPHEIAKELQTCAGLRKYVHSIGIEAMADGEDREETMHFRLNCRREKDYRGSVYETDVLCNGRESIIELADYPVREDDTNLASFGMAFPKYMTAKLTLRFYLNDGYEVPELQPDPPVDFDSQDYKDMIAKSAIYDGNLERLAAAIAKAQRGEDVTIAYIGGSITQGAGAKPIGTNSYAYQSYKAFRERYGVGDGSNVHFVKAGVGGTPSELGLCRYEREILRNGTVQPDILVIEFAVNDAGDETNGVCYESLALMAAKELGNPAVVLLFAVFMDDFNLQDRLSPVGTHYGFPMVSLKNAVTPQFYIEKPLMTKRQYFFDLFHPSNEGHRVMADCIDLLWKRAGESDCMKGAPAKEATKEEFDKWHKDIVDGYLASLVKEPIIGNDYRDLKVIAQDNFSTCPAVTRLDAGTFTATDKEIQYVERDDQAYVTPEFPENWMYEGASDDVAFEMDITCKKLMIIYKDSGDQGKFGTATVYVDGKEARSINPLEVGWNHINAVLIHTGDNTAEHKVKICPTKEKNFTIFGFGYTE